MKLKQKMIMQHYTTIEQSKHLLELGLNPESADMRYVIKHDIGGRNIGHYPMIGREPSMGTIPCWSLGALLEVMPEFIKKDDTYYHLRINCTDYPWNWFLRYYARVPIEGKKRTIMGDATIGDTECQNLLEAAYLMTCWLLEKNYLKA